jgi:hypothetical protein
MSLPNSYVGTLKSFTRDILLGDTVQQVRLVVFDRVAHAVGSLTIPVNAAGK